MRVRTIRTLQALAFGVIPITLAAFSTGPPIMRTGAAVDGGLACNVCHTSFPLNDDSGGSVLIRTGGYTPGLKQMIEVVVNHPTAQRFGFQLTARLASDETKPAGTFTADDNIRVRCAPAGADGPCNGALEFAEHRQPTTNAGNPGPRTFLIEWTPPATDVGPIAFYAAGNAANNNGNPTGDHIYTTKSMIVAAPNSGVSNSASGAPTIAPNTWVSIFGSNLATGTRPWATKDIVSGKLPTSLDGTSVTVNGKDAFVYFISPTQVNVLTPADDMTGNVSVKVTANGAVKQTLTASIQPFSPALFSASDGSIIAQHGDYSIVTAASPAKPGETIILWGCGFGATDPASTVGQVLASSARLVNPVKVRIGGIDVVPSFAGIAATGLYQINVTVPEIADGAAAVVATIGGYSTPGTATIPVKK